MDYTQNPLSRDETGKWTHEEWPLEATRIPLWPARLGFNNGVKCGAGR